MNGRPSVVLPSVWSWMRGLDFDSAVKYATTCDHAGSLRSVPGAKPITDAGVGNLRAPAPARRAAMELPARVRSRCGAALESARCASRSCVDLAELVGGLEHVADLARECARLDGRAVDVADGRLHTG